MAETAGDIAVILALIEGDHANEVTRLRRNWAIAQERISALEKQIDQLQGTSEPQ